MIDINVVCLPMPVNECVTQNADGSYTIFIRDSLTYEKKRDAYIHALGHIEKDDLHADICADTIEKYSHS